MNEEDKIGTLTRLLRQVGSGDEIAESRFCELIYDELRQCAIRILPNSDGSIQPTMLVNELYLKLRSALGDMPNRKYFFSAATDQMRKILIDHLRKRSSLKRGGDDERVPLDYALDHLANEFSEQNRFDVDSLEKALEKLKERNSRQYDVVRYRFYGGLSVSDTAEILDVSVGTVERDWRLARAKLYAELRQDFT